jgi:hypothetical protein
MVTRFFCLFFPKKVKLSIFATFLFKKERKENLTYFNGRLLTEFVLPIANMLQQLFKSRQLDIFSRFPLLSWYLQSFASC